MITETIELPRAHMVASVALPPVSRPGIRDPGEETPFDFCDVLAAGFERPADGPHDGYTYDAPVIRGRTSPNADILSRRTVYKHLGTR